MFENQTIVLYFLQNFTKKHLPTAALLCLQIPVLFSQNHLTSGISNDTAVANLFPKNAPLEWVKYFSGRLDDVSDVDISLGFDGKNCRGFLTYTESRTRLRLEGSLKKDELILREIAKNGETSGFLHGIFRDKKFDADWSNYNSTLGGRLETEEVNVSQIGVSHCGDNKWLNRYATKLNGGAFEITLFRANNGLLTGEIWLEKERKTYFLKGEMQPDGTYFLNVSKPGGASAGQLRGAMQYLQNLEVAWHTSGGGKQFFNLSLLETLSVGCYESADFFGGYDVIYPKTKSHACNSWFERQVAGWLGMCKNQFTKNLPEPIPANRDIQRASAWPEISLWSDDFFCGILSFSESWHDFPQGKSFNFDLQKNKEIGLEDIFIKNFNAKNWLETEAQKQGAKLPEISKPEFRSWLEKVGFPMWNISRDGLEMSSPFHPMFGRQRVLISWATLKPYLKKESLVIGLM